MSFKAYFSLHITNKFCLIFIIKKKQKNKKMKKESFPNEREIQKSIKICTLIHTHTHSPTHKQYRILN